MSHSHWGLMAKALREELHAKMSVRLSFLKEIVLASAHVLDLETMPGLGIWHCDAALI